MNYWTKEEYLRFIESMKDKKYYYAHMFPGVQENMAERLDAERNLSITCVIK